MDLLRHRALLGVLLLSTTLNVCGITWGLPSVLGWAADELTPMRVLTGMRQGFGAGWHDPYPPFHFYVLAAAYAHVTAARPRVAPDADGAPAGSQASRWRTAHLNHRGERAR